jgi:hypothetical protein
VATAHKHSMHAHTTCIHGQERGGGAPSPSIAHRGSPPPLCAPPHQWCPLPPWWRPGGSDRAGPGGGVLPLPPARAARARVARTPRSGLGADLTLPAPLPLPVPPPPPPPPCSPGGAMGEACGAPCPAPVALPPARGCRLVLRGGGTGGTPAPSSSLPASGVSSGGTPCGRGTGGAGGDSLPLPTLDRGCTGAGGTGGELQPSSPQTPVPPAASVSSQPWAPR